MLLAGLLVAALPAGAWALDDCGPPVGDLVICNAANEVDSYQDEDGIDYVAPELTIDHRGNGSPTEFIHNVGEFGDITILSSAPVRQTAVSAGHAVAGLWAQSGDSNVLISTTAAGWVQTESDDVAGIYGRAQGGNVTIRASGAVQTSGHLAYGILAGALGTVDIVSQEISTQGNAAHGIAVFEGAFTIVRANAAITTAGDGANGIYLYDVGSVDLTSRAITTAGSGAAGIWVEAEGAVTIRSLGAISTSGFAGTGIFARSQGAISINAGSVVARGDLAVAVSARADNGVTIALDHAQGGYGNGWGVAFGSEVAGVDSTLTVRSGGSVGALSDRAILGFSGGDTTVWLAGRAVGMSQFAEGADALRILSGGRYELRNFADSDGDGLRDTADLATLEFGLGDDLLRIESGGLLALGIGLGDDIGEISGADSVRNAGVLTLADRDVGGAAADAGDRLIFTHGYGAEPGASLRLDVRLDGGGPGAQLTDRLLVVGDVTGTTAVRVFNDLGQGAGTGLLKTSGISIVQVAGNAAADSFYLAEPVVAGAFEYSLRAYDPSVSSASERDPLLPEVPFWDYRLQNTLASITAEYPTTPFLPSQMSQAAMDYLTWVQAMAAEAQAYAVETTKDQIQQMSSLGAGDVQEAVRPTAGDGVASVLWGGVFGEGLQVSPGSGTSFEQVNVGFMAGHDLFAKRGLFGEEDRLVAGLYGALSEGAADFSGSDSTLDVSLLGGGAYATYAAGGLRTNLVAQVLTGTADYVVPVSGVDSSLDVTTLGLGAAVAWRFDLGQVFLEPGADLRWVRTWMEDFQDASGADIGLEDSDSLVAGGRLKAGLTFDHIAPYLSLGVSHEFLGESRATASGLTFKATTEGTTFEVGGGIAAWALASNLSLALDAGWRFGDEVEGFAVSGGVKFSW